MADLTLSREQRKLLRKALESSYLHFSELKIMVHFELGVRLGFADETDLGIGVAKVIEWAEANGHTKALSDALIQQRPNNPEVRKYAAALNDQEDDDEDAAPSGHYIPCGCGTACKGRSGGAVPGCVFVRNENDYPHDITGVGRVDVAYKAMDIFKALTGTPEQPKNYYFSIYKCPKCKCRVVNKISTEMGTTLMGADRKCAAR